MNTGVKLSLVLVLISVVACFIMLGVGVTSVYLDYAPGIWLSNMIMLVLIYETVLLLSLIIAGLILFILWLVLCLLLTIFNVKFASDSLKRIGDTVYEGFKIWGH